VRLSVRGRIGRPSAQDYSRGVVRENRCLIYLVGIVKRMHTHG